MDSLDQDISDEALDGMIKDFQKMRKDKGVEEKSFTEQIADMEKHPAFMREFDPSQPLTPEVEGLMQLKYEDENPVAKATAYKEDGNYEFQKKKYKIAIANYTEAILVKCPDRLLNAVLYTNRAAAQFHLGNYRTAVNDCIFARKFKPDHMKAIDRGAQSLFEIKKYEECVKWADEALQIDSTNKKILDLRNKASKLQKAIDRDKRKELLQERKKSAEEIKLVQAIESRSIKLEGVKDKQLTPALLASQQMQYPQGSKVHLDANNVLYWPVMFLYPEYQESDYIRIFCENHRLIDHLNHMFGADPPAWDLETKYKPHTINVYFEDKEKEKLIKLNKEKTLAKILQHERYLVYGGTPSFLLTVAGSVFEKSFLDKFGAS